MHTVMDNFFCGTNYFIIIIHFYFYCWRLKLHHEGKQMFKKKNTFIVFKLLYLIVFIVFKQYGKKTK